MNNKKIRLNNNELISAFINNTYISGSTDLVGSNLKARYIRSSNIRVLINYTTPIAIIDVSKDYNTLILNTDKYSHTTTVNQNTIKYEAIKAGMTIKEVNYNEIMRLYWGE